MREGIAIGLRIGRDAENRIHRLDKVLCVFVFLCVVSVLMLMCVFVSVLVFAFVHMFLLLDHSWVTFKLPEFEWVCFPVALTAVSSEVKAFPLHPLLYTQPLSFSRYPFILAGMCGLTGDYGKCACGTCKGSNGSGSGSGG